MNAQQLKNSILQLAVQGKLVPQDPSEEPASALLARISKEREQLIKEKKIKKPKKTSHIFRRDGHFYESLNGGKPTCIDNDLPFDIPDSWEWVRCSSLGQIVRGNGIKRSEIVPEGISCVRYGELYTTYDTTFFKAKSHISNELAQKCKIFTHGAILFTLTGENKPDIGKASAYLGEQGVAAGGDLAFWEHHGMNPTFLANVLNSPYAVGEKIKKATGDIIVHISGDKIGAILIPIPPIHEQERIVKTIGELLPHIEEYGRHEDELAKLNKSFPEALKKSLLQWAIQGKLMQQDENDEPASALLEIIAKERAAKLGKKAAKSMSRIERRGRETYYEVFADGSEENISDKIPFEIPGSWAWCRLDDLLCFCSTGPFGSMIHKDDYINTSDAVPLINPTNIKSGRIDEHAIKKVSHKTKKRLKRYLLKGGYLIMARRGDLSKCAIVTSREDGWLCGTGAFFLKTRGIINEYFQILYSSSYVQCYLSNDSIGTTMTNLNQSMLKKLLIPLPPEKEQLRIRNMYASIMRILHLQDGQGDL